MRYPVDNYKTEWNNTAGYSHGDSTPYGFHDGDDINDNKGGDSDMGKPLYAISKGKIIGVHQHTGKGNFGKHFFLQIEGAWGIRYVHYAHCNELFVVLDQEVTEGQRIATLGNSGTVYAHCHFSIKKKTNGMDTIAKTKVQLDDAWENPNTFIEKYLKGGTNMTSYKGYDLDNKDSMKVAVDVLVRVQAGEFVDKPEAEKTIRELEAKTEQINELTKENFDLNTEVVRLRDEIAELKSANQTLNNKIIDLNAAMEKDAVHDRDLEVKNTELEHQITELNNQITKLKEEKQAPLEPVIDHYEPILEEFWKNLFKGKSRKSISDKFWEWVR